jgi:acetoin utilization protein AcuB
MSGTTVQEYMSPEPLTIGPQASLAEAYHAMRERALRHLPVVDVDGRLVGVISERDVNVARTLKSVTLEKAKVELVMSTPPLAVAPDTRLSDVAARMIDRKAGSAVVVHEGRVVGIFTSHDALHALHRLLGVT